MSKIKKIERYIYSKLSEKRLKHCYGVASTALLLKGFYGLNISAVIIAGLGHDCAKWMTAEKMEEYICEHKIKIFEHEHRIFQLWHGPIAAHILKNEIGINNKNILYAVRNHTIAQKNEKKFFQLIYIADYIEPLRERKSTLNYQDFDCLNDLFHKIRELKMQFIASTGRIIVDKKAETEQKLKIKS